MEDIVQSIAQGLELLESFGEIPMRETFATDVDDSFGDENKTFSIRGILRLVSRGCQSRQVTQDKLDELVDLVKLRDTLVYREHSRTCKVQRLVLQKSKRARGERHRWTGLD